MAGKDTAMDMSEILTRIDLRRAEMKRAGENTSDRSISIESGLSADALRNWRRAVRNGKDSGANTNSIRLIAKRLGVSEGWLLGEDETPQIRLVSDEDIVAAGTSLINVYDIEASAGGGLVPEGYETVASRLAFPPGYLNHITTTSPNNLAVISVVGSSMVPTLYHNDIVMVDFTKTNIAYDGMFVIFHNDLLKVKRLKWGTNRDTVIVVSDNFREYPEEEHPASEIAIRGRVVWVGKKEP